MENNTLQNIHSFIHSHVIEDKKNIYSISIQVKMCGNQTGHNIQT